MAMGAQAQAPTESQVYLSTRGGECGLSFETVVLKGLGGDGGLFMPHQIPQADWGSWDKLSYKQLAFRIFSLFISSTEIPAADLETIIERSYSTFRDPDIVAPLKHYWDRLHVLELFHGPSLSFKDCALQFLGNLFEYLLARKNAGRQGQDRHHMTVVCATSGDTGSAAIHGLKGKKDISVIILHPEGRVSPVQEAQMTTCLDANVHNLAVQGTFDDCQEIVKTLFADPNTNQALELGAVNSINWARILAQIVYYFHSYFSLIGQSGNAKLGDKIRFVVPTGNFGDILAGYFAYRMGLPVEKLVIATNENDILDRFWKTGRYETRPGRCMTAEGAQAKEATVRATLSPAMDIVVSSNFERLLWFLAYEMAAMVGMDKEFNMKQAGQEVKAWFKDLKLKGGFGPVHKEILERARVVFESERVTDEETMKTICDAHSKRERGLLPLDPHAAVGVTVALRSMERTEPHVQHISLATAHPGKFPDTVKRALNMSRPDGPDPDLADGELAALEGREKRVTRVENDWKAVREMIKGLIKK